MIKSMNELLELWDKLTDIPTDGLDGIEEDFLHFKVGTHREDVWHWFEEQNPDFSVYKIQNGVYDDLYYLTDEGYI